MPTNWVLDTVPENNPRARYALLKLSNGKVAMFGGYDASFTEQPTLYISSDAQLTGWDRKTDAPTTIASPSMTELLNGDLLIVGQNGNGSPVSYRFHIGSNSWSSTALDGEVLATLNQGSITTLNNGKAAHVGGRLSNNSQISNKVRLYDPTGDSWSVGATLTDGRTLHASTKLQDGRVFVCGGYSTVTHPPTLQWALESGPWGGAAPRSIHAFDATHAIAASSAYSSAYYSTGTGTWTAQPLPAGFVVYDRGIAPFASESDGISRHSIHATAANQWFIIGVNPFSAFPVSTNLLIGDPTNGPSGTWTEHLISCPGIAHQTRFVPTTIHGAGGHLFIAGIDLLGVVYVIHSSDSGTTWTVIYQDPGINNNTYITNLWANSATDVFFTVSRPNANISDPHETLVKHWDGAVVTDITPASFSDVGAGGGILDAMWGGAVGEIWFGYRVNGSLWHTTNTGSSWSQHTDPTGSVNNGPSALGGDGLGNMELGFSSNTTFTSTNSGSTWTLDRDFNSYGFASGIIEISYINSNNFYAAFYGDTRIAHKYVFSTISDDVVNTAAIVAADGLSSIVVGPMVHARSEHQAVLVADGRVLIVGGYDNNNTAVLEAETFDPGTGLCTVSGTMTGERYGFAAGLIPDGRVVVAGGWQLSNSDTQNGAEFWTSGVWSDATSLNFNRAYASGLYIPTNISRFWVPGGENVSGGGATDDVLGTSEYLPVPGAAGPSISLAKTVDEITVDILFDDHQPMPDEAGALIPSNWTIDNGLTCLSVTRITAFNYRLTTSPQTIGTVYTITTSGM